MSKASKVDENRLKKRADRAVAKGSQKSAVWTGKFPTACYWNAHMRPLPVFLFRALLLVGIASSSFFASERRAEAQQPTSTSTSTTNEQMLAQSLFDDGRQLMDRGRYAEACPKLAESQRLDPGGGTLLNLAICHEKEGKLGSAYLEMKSASSQASKDGRKDREKIANEHLAVLTPRVPKLSVHVVREEADLEVRVDTMVLRKPAWDLLTVVDPGQHVVDAVVPGKVPFRKTITLAEGEQRSVQIPAFDTAAAVGTTQTTSMDLRTRDSVTTPQETRTNPWFVASVATGVTGFTIGLPAAYIWAMLKLTESTCAPDRLGYASSSMFCASSGVRDAWFATAALGLTVGTLGVIGIATVPRKIDVVPMPSANGGGVMAVGMF